MRLMLSDDRQTLAVLRTGFIKDMITARNRNACRLKVSTRAFYRSVSNTVDNVLSGGFIPTGIRVFTVRNIGHMLENREERNES
jgi:hypothetical protein